MKKSEMQERISSALGKRKAGKVMREFHAGTLHHGSTGKVVTRPDIAKAIAMSEARKA